MQLFIMSAAYTWVVEEEISLCYSCNFSVSLNVFQNNKNTSEIRKSWGTFRCSLLFEKSVHVYVCMYSYFKITFPAHIYQMFSVFHVP